MLEFRFVYRFIWNIMVSVYIFNFKMMEVIVFFDLIDLFVDIIIFCVLYFCWYMYIDIDMFCFKLLYYVIFFFYLCNWWLYGLIDNIEWFIFEIDFYKIFIFCNVNGFNIGV